MLRPFPAAPPEAVSFGVSVAIRNDTLAVGANGTSA
jgi:FG-GAP repeat